MKFRKARCGSPPIASQRNPASKNVGIKIILIIRFIGAFRIINIHMILCRNIVNMSIKGSGPSKIPIKLFMNPRIPIVINLSLPKKTMMMSKSNQ
ncbi:MAG: hypothetical protein CMH62_02300 [Nanoarchaeota archaeon]|nr:hypothetical protein [Nanoarchaeota archaeon]